MAVVNQEPERDRFLELMAASDETAISAVTLFETRMVVWGRLGQAGLDKLNDLVREIGPRIFPFESRDCVEAFKAFQRYGKGVDPRARLNFGDCASYALAKTLNAPLLYKGDDFAATDIEAASQT